MKRFHFLERFWIGVGTGCVIGLVITILVSYSHGGEYFAAMPALVRYFEREVDAVAVQFALFSLVGATFAVAGAIFQCERPSFLAKCVIHFAITGVVFLPFLRICYYSQEPIWKPLVILGNLAFTYVVTWLFSYFQMRAEVKALNRKIEEYRRNSL